MLSLSVAKSLYAVIRVVEGYFNAKSCNMAVSIHHSRLPASSVLLMLYNASMIPKADNSITQAPSAAARQPAISPRSKLLRCDNYWSPVAQFVSYFGRNRAAQALSEVLTGRYEDKRVDEVRHIMIRRIRKLGYMSLLFAAPISRRI